MSRLRTHSVRLVDGPLVLRPMTEADWEILLPWNNDPVVMYYAEGGEITSLTLAEVQEVYRTISKQAYMFIVELEGRPAGECWLETMNLKRLRRRHPGRDVRRIDLLIGDKTLWGQGWGTRIIRLLTAWAFQTYGVDVLYGPDIADYNVRSRRAFEKNGYTIDLIVPQPAGNKAKVTYDMVLAREVWQAMQSGEASR